MKKHIFFTGFMGAGKSRIGRTLATKWGWPFIDTDSVIEEEVGESVDTIFQIRGENWFRNRESEVIRALAKDPYPAIIALGGGALKEHANLLQIRAHGLLVYLQSTPLEILQRVKHSDKRPLLRVPREGDFEQNLLKKIEQLLDEREPMYRQADIICPRNGQEAPQIVARLETMIHQAWENNNA